MASRQKILVSLRFRHPSISASELIKRVGLKPAVAHEKGTRRSTVGGKVRTNPQAYCSFPIRVASLKFPSRALEKGIAILERDETYWNAFLSSGGSMDFFIGIFVDSNIGWTISNDLLASMAKWKIDLGLDIYGPEKDIEKKKKLREAIERRKKLKPEVG